MKAKMNEKLNKKNGTLRQLMMTCITSNFPGFVTSQYDACDVKNGCHGRVSMLSFNLHNFDGGRNFFFYLFTRRLVVNYNDMAGNFTFYFSLFFTFLTSVRVASESYRSYI